MTMAICGKPQKPVAAASAIAWQDPDDTVPQADPQGRQRRRRVAPGR